MESGIAGTLSFVVWPVYVGVCNAELGTPPLFVDEPINDEVYERGQITWAYENEKIVGRARVIVPMGFYTHLLYFQHPTKPELTGITKMLHPIRMTEIVNVIDVYPIVNDDTALNVPLAAP